LGEKSLSENVETRAAPIQNHFDNVVGVAKKASGLNRRALTPTKTEKDGRGMKRRLFQAGDRWAKKTKTKLGGLGLRTMTWPEIKCRAPKENTSWNAGTRVLGCGSGRKNNGEASLSDLNAK